MEKPQDFPKALCMLQIFEIVLYVVAAVVIYYYVGNDVASPALGSAGPIMKKVAYGIAIPTVCFALDLFVLCSERLTYPDYWCRSGQRPCRSQIPLCPYLPQLAAAHGPARPGLGWIVGGHWIDLLDHRLDHR